MAEIRESKRRQKGKRILEAALKLFSERGFYGTAVPLIAAEAGVGAGTIYRYFPSKEALVNALYRERKSAMMSAVFDGFPWNDDPPAKFRWFWARLATYARDERPSFVFMELHHHAPYLDAESQAMAMQMLMPILTFVEEAQAQGVLRDDAPAMLLAMVWGALIGLIKACQLGHLELTDDLITASGDSAWAAIVRPS